MPKQAFNEILHSLFYDILRSAGVSLTPQQLEKVSKETAKLAKAIDIRTEEKSIEVIKRLQSAVVTSFESVAKDIVKVERGITKLNKATKEDVENLENLRQQVSKLREYVYGIKVVGNKDL
jgi:uncharacterized membrane protein YgaE (UPF0421/DUF939 family)